jgi:hypothetical protein
VIGGGECEQCRRRRLGGEGRRLEPEVARRFAGDTRLLASVRVHDGARGAAVARGHGAAAVAEGADLFFAPDAYRPGTAQGIDLLAHELVHVAQQHRSDGPAPGHRSRAGDAWEREADRLARRRVLPPVPARAAPRPAPQRRTAAEQVATVLRRAAEGLGTDEDAIFNALAGRTPQEIDEIKKAYVALSGGETLEEMLRDELSGDDLEHALSLLQGRAAATEGTPTALAMRIRDAVEGPGTDEEAIYGALTGRSADELMKIRAEYSRLYGESLVDRLKDELSGGELIEGLVLERGGLLEPEDEIKVAVEGAGTDEERLFAVLEEINKKGTVLQTIEAYANKGYGDMLEDIRGDLSGSDLDRAMELLHGKTIASANCSPDQRSSALEWLSKAISLAQNAIAKLSAVIAAGKLSSEVETALTDNFNPGGAPNAVNVQLAAQVNSHLVSSRIELLHAVKVDCPVQDAHCKAHPDCHELVPAWTTGAPDPSVVHLCIGLFQCSEVDRPVALLHEFIHHTGAHLKPEVYHWDKGKYRHLTPPQSLANAESYAWFARDVE